MKRSAMSSCTWYHNKDEASIAREKKMNASERWVLLSYFWGSLQAARALFPFCYNTVMSNIVMICTFDNWTQIN